MEEFRLDTPALVCRWRLANGELPLQNRHLRALAARTINGERASSALVAWVKQQVEWSLEEAAGEHPDGVLMLLVDKGGAAALSLGDYQPLDNAVSNNLLARARESRREAQATGVAPEELWVVRGDVLVRGASSDFAVSGAASLIVDLARTMGMPVQRDEDLLDRLERPGAVADEVFLVSDEHGVVPARDRDGRRAEKFAQSYRKLLVRRWRRP